MKVLEQTEINLEWKDIPELYEHPILNTPRSAGVHLSNILRKVAIDTGQLSEGDRDDEMPLRVFLGLAWEAMAVRLYKDIAWQPGEFERDGIYMTPDGISEIKGLGTVVEEFKYTGKSLRVKGGDKDQLKSITGEWMWIQQGLGYCNAVGTDLVRYHVCWSRGVYSYPMVERYIRYLVQFSRLELEGNWKMVMKNKYKV